MNFSITFISLLLTWMMLGSMDRSNQRQVTGMYGGGSKADKSNFVLDSLGPRTWRLRLMDRSGPGSRWMVPHRVFRFEIADLDRDGIAEACVGVVKRTRYDTTLRRRLFVFRRLSGTIRPAWLGSRMGRELVDFRILADSNHIVIRTVDDTKRGRNGYAVMDWRWSTFGPRFVDVRATGLTKSRALWILAHDSFWR